MVGRGVLSGAILIMGVSLSAAQSSGDAAKGSAKKDEPTKVKTIAVDSSGAIKPGAAAKAPPANAAAALPGKTDAKTPETTKSLDAASSERLALQSDLAWIGAYNGLIDGQASDRLGAATKDYQKSHGGEPTGTLTPQQRTELATQAKTVQVQLGWKIVTDIGSGARLGLPQKLLPNMRMDSQGTRWSNPQDTISVTLTRRREQGLTLAAMAEREKKEPAGRKVEYATVQPNFYVVSGEQGSNHFYARGQLNGGEMRSMTVQYDQAGATAMAPVIVAMSSAFNPFPNPGDLAASPKPVEYATGTFVSNDGAILADRSSVEGCTSIAVQGHGNAAWVAEDGVRDLALVHLYGAQTTPVAVAGGAGLAANVTITGIPDPQNQNGGAAVTRVRAQTAALNGEIALAPVAAPGLAGAPAFDDQGHFVGVVVTKASALSKLAPADSVRAFLSANGVTPADDIADIKASDANASVVRLICVR
jgi:hypothetical protein